MKKIQWKDLGNFGFLKDYGMDYLHDLAQLMEGNLYINPRLCAVYLRLLLEGFFDEVVHNLDVNTINWNNPEREVILSTKIYRVIRKCNQRSSNFRDYIDVFPTVVTSAARFPCPPGRGDDKREDGSLIDPNTIYCWHLARHVGNAAAHSKIMPESYEWLQEQYLLKAVQEICNRMYAYYRIKHHLDYQPNHFRKPKSAFATRQIIYSSPEDPSAPVRKQERNGDIPAFEESLCHSVTADSNSNIAINKYYLVRKYVIEGQDEIKTYLLHSQKAYLILQQSGKSDGLAPFNVLAGLGTRTQEEELKTANVSPYYVASYEFNAIPEALSKKLLAEIGVYREKSLLKYLFHRLASTLNDMCNARVYHRCLTHESVRVIRYEKELFSVRLIDLELCKLSGKHEEKTTRQQGRGETVVNQANSYNLLKGNLKQYNGPVIWTDSTTGEEYERETIRRLGCLFANILCPAHLAKDASYERSASTDEITRFFTQELPANEEMKEYVLQVIAPLIEKMTSSDDAKLPEILNTLEG